MVRSLVEQSHAGGGIQQDPPEYASKTCKPHVKLHRIFCQSLVQTLLRAVAATRIDRQAARPKRIEWTMGLADFQDLFWPLGQGRIFPVKEIWEFPKIGGTLFWCPYNKDPTI